MYYFPWSKETNNEHVFYYHLNNGKHKKAKGRIVIRFSHDCIRFYWNNVDYGDPLFPENQHIFSINLSSKKTIGNDILAINEKEIKNVPVPKEIKIDNGSITDFIREFIVEVEKEQGIFASNVIVNTVRRKLQKSIIYKLVIAKHRYERYLSPDKSKTCQSSYEGLDSDEYNSIVAEYSDLLMDSKLTSILPPNKVGKGYLFENPEYELQRIMQTNSKLRWTPHRKRKRIFLILGLFCILVLPFLFQETLFCSIKVYHLIPVMTLLLLFVEITREKKCKLKKNIITKIQSFLFKKHSTISAYRTITGRAIYCITWVSAIFYSAFLIFHIFNYGNCKEIVNKGDYEKFLIEISIMFVANALVFIVNALLNKNYNSLYPRICIALAASWALIVLSGDFVFSLLWSDSIGWLTVFFGILIFVVLIFDAKSCSPYYYVVPLVKKFWHKTNWSSCNWKILPVFSVSLFLSFCMGAAIQYATYKDLLKEDNMLYSVTFSSEFKSIEHHITNTQLLVDNLEAYKREISHFPKDSSKIHTSRKNHINTIKQQLHHQDMIKEWLDPITEKELKTNQEIAHRIDALLPLLHSHLYSHQNFITQFYDADNLLNLCCDTTSYVQHRVIYNEFFNKDKFSKNIIPVKVEFCCIHISFYLFPKLLVFHAFLAVLIAFIVQIIFTGKSVTEGL